MLISFYSKFYPISVLFTNNIIFINFVYRSNEDGNCLYSAVAMALNKGGSAHVLLRLLTSIELFEKASFYSNYPYFLDLFEKNKGTFASLNSIFSCCLTYDSIDDSAAEEKGVRGNKNDMKTILRNEAIKNCEEKRYSSFICMIALSSVIKRRIISHYPDCGMYKYRLIFNTVINPRSFLPVTPGNVQILWCNTNTETLKLENWSPNHFVPLVEKNSLDSDVNEIGQKRKPKQMFPQIEKRSGGQTRIGFSQKSLPSNLSQSESKPSNWEKSGKNSVSNSSIIRTATAPTKGKELKSQTKIKFETISIPLKILFRRNSLEPIQ